MEQQNENQPPKDYILSLYEVCEILGKSSRTVSRYVHRDILHPVGIKSRQGTLEYRFSRSEVEVLKQREDEIRQFNYMPQLANMRQNMAAFASVNYQQPRTMPRPPFGIPGISFPIAPGQTPASQPAAPIQPPAQSFQKEPEPVAAPVENNQQENSASEPVAAAANVQDPAPVQDHSNEQIIILLKETTEMLRDQLQVKDGQIKNLDEKIGQLIERNRETNILLKGLQDKMVLLEKPKNERKVQPRTEPSSAAGEDASPSASPAPKVVESVANPIKVKIARDDVAAYGQEDGRQKNISQNQNKILAKEGRDEVQLPAQKNDGQAGKGFFGKIFG